MSDSITFDIDGSEAHVLEAALALYRGSLDKARDLGGPPVGEHARDRPPDDGDADDHVILRRCDREQTPSGGRGAGGAARRTRKRRAA